MLSLKKIQHWLEIEALRQHEHSAFETTLSLLALSLLASDLATFNAGIHIGAASSSRIPRFIYFDEVMSEHDSLQNGTMLHEVLLQSSHIKSC